MAFFARFVRIVNCWEKAIFETSDTKPFTASTRVTVSSQTSNDFPESLKSALTIPDIDVSGIQCGAGSSQTVLTSLLPVPIAIADPKSESNTGQEIFIADTKTQDQSSSECDLLKLKLSELTDENQKLVCQVSKSNKNIALMQLQIRGRTSARDNLQSQNADLQQDILQLTKMLDNLENKLRDAEQQHRKDLDERQAKMQVRIKEVQKQLEFEHKTQLHSELAKVQVQHGIYETRISYLEAEVTNLQRTISSHQEELVETRAQFEDCLENLSNLQQANCHLNDSLQQQQIAYEEAFQELAECEETIKKMRVFHAVRMESNEEKIQKLKLQVNEVTANANASANASSAEVTPNYYKLLGVDRQTPQQHLKKAYYAKSLEHHPDRVTHPDDRKKSETRFKLMKRAYEMLSHPELKKVYDNWFDQTVINSSYQRVYCNTIFN